MKEPLWVWFAAMILGMMFPVFFMFLPEPLSIVIWIAVMIFVMSTSAYLENRHWAKIKVLRKG